MTRARYVNPIQQRSRLFYSRYIGWMRMTKRSQNHVQRHQFAVFCMVTLWAPRGPESSWAPMDVHGPMGTWLTTDWPSARVAPIFGCFLFLSHVQKVLLCIIVSLVAMEPIKIPCYRSTGNGRPMYGGPCYHWEGAI